MQHFRTFFYANCCVLVSLKATKKYRLKPSRRISAYVVSRLVALNREDNGAMWRSCSKAR